MAPLASDTTTTNNLSAMLKDGTWDLHRQAESAAVPAMMLGGTISRDTYVAVMSQLLPANRALDEAIIACRPTCPPLADLVDDEQLQTPALEADLRHFGVDPASVTPGPGATSAVEAVEAARRDNPVALLGMHYVREGANNGNRFLAQKLRPIFDAAPDQQDGFRHLDPYGEHQRGKWATFKEGLDRIELDEASKQACVSAARDMFRFTMAIHADCEPDADTRGSGLDEIGSPVPPSPGT